MRVIIAPVLLVLAICSCAPKSSPADALTQFTQGIDRNGRVYLGALAETIQRSDRISVTEHSYQYDAYHTEAGKSLIPNEIVYGTRELDASRKAIFLSTVNALDPKTQDAFAACIFEPHHTVRFYTAGKLTSTMEICFECGQVEWDGTKATPPWSLPSGLATFIKDIGFSPDRDWAILAKQHWQ
jgi:hypothetical protein